MKELVDSKDLVALKVLLLGENWPQAVPNFMICGESEEGKFERAEGILNFVGEDLKDLKVLDFGCGLGHTVVKVTEFKPKKSVGYEILSGDSKFEWENDGAYLLTTDFAKVKIYAPYNVIILYDVLDHCNDPIELLTQVKDLCDSKTRVHIRCHPFISRHGGNLYRVINKAYVHLIFTDKELADMGHKMDFVRHVYHPLQDYKNWFDKVGFKVMGENSITNDVEEIFKNNSLIQDRLVCLYKQECQNVKEVVGTWTHNVGGEDRGYCVIFPNGKLSDWHGGNTWKLNDTLTFYWQDNNAPNGVWIDEVVINATEYEGYNQLGTKITGKKIKDMDFDFPYWNMNKSFLDFVVKMEGA